MGSSQGYIILFKNAVVVTQETAENESRVSRGKSEPLFLF